MDTIDHLNPALRGKYRIKNTHLPRVLQTPVGDINFGTLTDEQAEKLVAADFYYLERNPAATPAAPKNKKNGVSEADKPEDIQEA